MPRADAKAQPRKTKAMAVARRFCLTSSSIAPAACGVKTASPAIMVIRRASRAEKVGARAEKNCQPVSPTGSFVQQRSCTTFCITGLELRRLRSIGIPEKRRLVSSPGIATPRPWAMAVPMRRPGFCGKCSRHGPYFRQTGLTDEGNPGYINRFFLQYNMLVPEGVENHCCFGSTVLQGSECIWFWFSFVLCWKR